MGFFLNYVNSNSSSRSQFNKYRQMTNWTNEEIEKWIMDNFKMSDIVAIAAGCIKDELNQKGNTPITISIEEFEAHFRIRKPQQNPHSKKGDLTPDNSEND